ncbi:RecBCD enzyme subunit RecB [Pararobbsia alpina]|uniref:exodeoxyribonuclease V subunit beta n=1 Tax=Pararobbsia alpina TaxID=621374 RepID=UPI0039A42E1A
MSDDTLSGQGAGAAVPRPLDALRFPLWGRSLIEASAGTGKTFTIAMLYVRLVLGHEGAQQDGIGIGVDMNVFDDGDGLDFSDDAGYADDDAETADAMLQSDEGVTRLRGPGRVATLTPPEILVVTFTDAATKELRDRIRARLSEAALYFQTPPDEVDPLPRGKDLLHDLRDDYPEERWLACARKLQLAAEWMDEAAVSTIHGWCNRMLREHAFDSDSLFTQALETDQTELLAEVVRDYWRSFMSSLDAGAASVVSDWFPDPDTLRAKIRALLEYADALPDGAPPVEAIGEAKRDAARELAALKAPWMGWLDAMEAEIDAAREAGQFAPRQLAKGNCTRWFNALRGWASDRAERVPNESAVAKLAASAIAQVCVQGEPPSHEGFVALETLSSAIAALPDGRDAVLRHAVKWIAKRFADEQGRRSQMGFNELLTKLDAALQGPNGERLANVIRTQFPVALIDEFQDTDPVQYRIFDTVYRDQTETGLIMIGDPKQAIYAFRGADIHTYLAARRACGDRLYTLARNFRSTREMVDAVNACFALAEHRTSGAGAFLFRTMGEGGESINPVPFVEVDAKGRDDRFVVDQAPATALTAWWLDSDRADGTLAKGAYLERMSAACATEMVALLNQGQRGTTGFEGTSGFRALRPADMAVLVNNRNEADAIRSALARRGVRSVYLSDKDSVFLAPPAAEIQHWLAACAEPDDGRLVRTALATRTLGLSWHELETLRGDELAWESCVMRFREYRDDWRRQGVLPMLRRILNDYRVPARLLETQAGERTLTDVLHVCELLQQASTLIEGEHGLIRWLAEERQAAQNDHAATGDAQQIRLESDGDLVKVVTVHKSKGLEYPLVFLPFACTFREVDIKDVPLKWHDDEGALHVELTATETTVARADRERLGEDLRKLYVALTRARYATWVGFAPLSGFERSAFGYLLNGGEALPVNGLEAVLEARFDACEPIAVHGAPTPDEARFVAVEQATRRGAARTSIDVVSEPWWIASYSSLKTAQGDEAAAADTPDEDVMMELLEDEPLDDEALDDDVAAGRRGAQAHAQEPAQGPAQGPAYEQTTGHLNEHATEPAQERADPDTYQEALQFGSSSAIHEFPRGSDPGSFLHDLLEWAATEGFGEVTRNPDGLRDVVARRCQVRGWERWIDTLTDWLLRLLSTPLALPDSGGVEPTVVRLSGLETYLAEMEFWIAAHAVNTLDIDEAVRQGTLDGARRPVLEPARLNGMLKGFMDLVFEHGGRYYVADYKSNWLGPDDGAYSYERMRTQILHSRYELQYVLYLFALHRLLRARLPDYDYDEHIGGAVYVFVRGIGAPTQGIHVERPPRELIDRLDDLFAHGDTRHAQAVAHAALVMDSGTDTRSHSSADWDDEEHA